MTGDRLLPADVAALAPQLTERRARLRFECAGDGHTFLSSQNVPYPLHICRPFYLPADPAGMATVYLQSCAGGIFEGDRLAIELLAGQGAQAHITTSASTIVHSMPVGCATQQVELTAAAHASLEFVPDPLILFPHSRLTSRVRVKLGDAATVLLADAFVLHDPSSQKQSFEWLHSEVAVEDEAGHLLVLDRVHASGAAIAERGCGVTGRYAAQGSFYALRRGADTGPLLARLRSALGSIEDIYAGASMLPNAAGMLVRVLARDALGLRAALQQAWHECRVVLAGYPPVRRRK